ncbi:MAG: TonB family protein [Desulfobacterota bacterium]|nr:TonB family protein [Thermodesulfobacteriota bacterium]
MVQVFGNNHFLDETSLLKMVIISGAIHFFSLFFFIFLPYLFSRPVTSVIPQYTPVILVGPGEVTGGGYKSSVNSVMVEKAKIAPATKKPDILQKKIDTKPIEISKTEPKKLKPTSPVTPKKEETSTSQAEEQKLNQAIENIRERVGNRNQEGEIESAVTGKGVGIGRNIEGGGSGAPEMLVYLSIVIDRITEAWFLPPGLKQEAIKRGLLTIIQIRIDRQGKVDLQGLQKSSGNNLFDDYALKAIQRVQLDSFPPLPEVYREPFLDLAVRFHPLEANT